MKLVTFLSGAFAVVSVTLACGCGGASSHASQAPLVATATATATAPEATGTTHLMSAELDTAPAPKVGKSHLVGHEGSSATEGDVEESDTPKEARRSDGSRRGGHFGTSK